MTQSEMWTVKQAAKRLGISEHTLRYYADQGFAPSMQRDANNRRLFNQNALDWLQACHYLRQTGMPIKVVKHYVALCLQGNRSLQERYQLIQEQQQLAVEQVQAAQQRLAFLNAKEKLYREQMATNSVDTFNPNNWSRNNQNQEC
ncbi:MerR family transcriptional regulator [Nicoliella lavandulae]|uniref:MerR family transcriptional regulator n=1 Tax=Nicoliella lavandulae TaxID=3082954 RepID=A0ABU8SKC6_9LACO